MAGHPLAAYDLDGVLCERSPQRPKPYFRQTGAERKEFEQIYRKHCRDASLLRRPREMQYVIVTGRPERVRFETETWLAGHALTPVALCMMRGARTRKNMIQFKLQVCRKFQVTRFYEDDPIIARALRKAGVSVILLGG